MESIKFRKEEEMSDPFAIFNQVFEISVPDSGSECHEQFGKLYFDQHPLDEFCEKKKM